MRSVVVPINIGGCIDVWQEDAVEQPEPTPEQDVASEPEEQEQEAPRRNEVQEEEKKVVYVPRFGGSGSDGDSEEFVCPTEEIELEPSQAVCASKRYSVAQQPMYSADYLRVFGSPY